MRKVIEQNPTQILVLCDDLELYGRAVVVPEACDKCDIHKMKEHTVDGKEMHCYGPSMMKAKMRVARKRGYARQLN